MPDLLMPSDVKRSGGEPAGAGGASPGEQVLPEPPSAKLIVQLFLVPLIIVAAAVGIMFLIGRLAGGTPSFEDALARLRNPGGGRTADLLVGPGSKQRYMDAKTVADKLLKTGATPAERARISNALVDVLDKHTTDREGDVRHFLLLAVIGYSMARVLWRTDLVSRWNLRRRRLAALGLTLPATLVRRPPSR